MALGKAFAALALGRSSSLVRMRAAGLKTDEDCAHLGPQVRLKN